jgi:hypothetical protein
MECAIGFILNELAKKHPFSKPFNNISWLLCTVRKIPMAGTFEGHFYGLFKLERPVVLPFAYLD